MINKQIEVIAYYDLQENLKPLRFKIEDEYGGSKTVSVEHSIVKSKNVRIVEFICNVLINGQKHQCEIWFYINEFRWVLIDMK